MNRRLHLITTCTRRKAGSVEDTVFPGDTSLDDAFDGWYRLIARPPAVLAGCWKQESFTGAHTGCVPAVSRRGGRASSCGPCPAGLGLRHHTDPAVAYEATFHAMPFAPATVWGSLTARPRWRAAAPPRLS